MEIIARHAARKTICGEMPLARRSRIMRCRGSGDLHECECGTERIERAARFGLPQTALELNYRVYLRAMRT